MKKIKLEIPMTASALEHASIMLRGMAADLDSTPIEAKIPASEGGTMLDPSDAVANVDYAEVETQANAEALAAFGDPKSPSAPSVETGPAQPATTETVPSVATAAEPATVTETPTSAPAGVDVDADGLPWDHRIHVSTKTKLAKTKQWKKKPGLATKSPGLLEQVEAELRAAMAASPAQPVVAEAATPASPAQPVVAEAATPASPAQPVVAEAATPASPAQPVVAEAAAVPITTFPALLSAITAAGIDSDTILKAVQSQGLQALPLVATRPDLIPAVVLALGL